MIKQPLPHSCHPNRRLKSIDGSVIHFISDRWRHPDDPFNFDHAYNLLVELGYSYHVYIPREGEPVELLPLHLEAWHAGLSRHQDRDYCNGWTHGIALAGKPGLEYTESQVIHLAQFLVQDMTANQYTTDFIVGHDTARDAWNTSYPQKADKVKRDPGPLFPWDQLFEMLEGTDMAVRAAQTKEKLR